MWSVTSILVDPRSHMRNVGIASYTPRCCHVALLQGQGPGLDRWRACAWDEALEAVDTLAAHIHPTVWLLAADLDARYLGAVPSSTQTRPRHLPTDGARRWAVMDTRSRLALQDDGWAGTEGPSFCAPLALYGALLRSPPAQGTCMISTQTGYGVPNGDPWG